MTGNLAVGGTATVSGNSGFLGTIRVSGATSLASTLSVAGAVNLLSTVTVSGATGFLTTVRVSGITSLEGNVIMKGTATVSGDAGFLGQISLVKSAAASVHSTAINGITSVSFGFASAQNFSTTVTAAHTLARPTGARVGQTGSIFFTQSGGSGTIAYNACWKFQAADDPTFTTSSGAVDRLDYIVLSVSSDGTGENIQAIMTQEYGECYYILY